MRTAGKIDRESLKILGNHLKQSKMTKHDPSSSEHPKIIENYLISSSLAEIPVIRLQKPLKIISNYRSSAEVITQSVYLCL